MFAVWRIWGIRLNRRVCSVRRLCVFCAQQFICVLVYFVAFVLCLRSESDGKLICSVTMRSYKTILLRTKLHAENESNDLAFVKVPYRIFMTFYISRAPIDFYLLPLLEFRYFHRFLRLFRKKKYARKSQFQIISQSAFTLIIVCGHYFFTSPSQTGHWRDSIWKIHETFWQSAVHFSPFSASTYFKSHVPHKLSCTYSLVAKLITQSISFRPIAPGTPKRIRTHVHLILNERTLTSVYHSNNIMTALYIRIR